MRTLDTWSIFRLVAATGLSTLLGLAIPAISEWVYKTYIPNPTEAGAWFALALALYLSVVVARATLGTIKSAILSSAKIRVSTSVQSAVMARILSRPLSFFQNTTSGRISTRINNCTKLSEMLLDIVMDVLLNLSFSMAYLFQLRNLEPALFLPAVIFLGLRIIVSVFSAITNMVNQSKQMKADVDSNGFLNSTIRGIQKIKVTGSAQKKIHHCRYLRPYLHILSNCRRK